jgi:hypothetical protein
MAQYYKDRPSKTPLGQLNKTPAEDATQAPVQSEFDKLRESLLTDDMEEGWASELRRYLGRMERDVTKETDLVEWWQVRNLLTLIYIPTLTHHQLPTEQCTVISNACTYRS